MTEERMPWGDKDDITAYEKWRRELVSSARNWAEGDISMFLNNRLSFQRGTRRVEIENFEPFETPDDALFDNFLVLRGEEYDSWTEEEYNQINNVMAAFISTRFDSLSVSSRRFLTNPESQRLDHYFSDLPQVKLNDQEAKALSIILKRVGAEINPEQRVFFRPS